MRYTDAQIDAVADHVSVGFIATRFAIDHWDQFRTWAATFTNDEWTDKDKHNVEIASAVLYALSEVPE